MKKEDFKKKTRELLDELAEHIEKLEQKAGEIAEDAKEQYHEQLEKLKEIRDNLAAKLNEYNNLTDSKWDVLKESAGNFFEDVSKSWKENFSNASEAFKKK